MFELYIDPITNKIVGYNKIVQDPATKDPDRIFLKDEYLPKIANGGLNEGLYYIDDEIVQKRDEEPDEFQLELQEVSSKLQEYSTKVENEQHIFMDNIINGMSIEEATKISKENRDKKEKFEKKKNTAEAKIADKREQKKIEKFEKEEANINYKYFLSMITIVRDENDYIEEWIRYHIEELGFDHFYIYDNESSVPVMNYLKNVDFKYFDRITFLEWKTSENSQTDSHMHFLENYSKETKWFLAADPDEYVLIKDNSKTLSEFLEENSQFAMIECIWHYFNADGQEKKKEGTDMERFTSEVDWWYGKNHGKKFAQSNRVKRFVNYTPQSRLEARTAGNETTAVVDFFQLNHYYTRSYEEWLTKINRGTCVPYARRKYSEFFELNPEMKYLDTGEEMIQNYGSAESLKTS